MKNKENLKTFSVKKLLLTILCTTIVSIFIGSTILFINAVPEWIQSETINGIEEGSETLAKIGSSYTEAYENLQDSFEESKKLYGEDYPAAELFILQLIIAYSNAGIMHVYSLSVLIGIALGTIIYIVAIQNTNKKQILIELIVAFVILYILLMLANWGYRTFINKTIQRINSTNVEYSASIYDLENYNIFIPYIIVAVVIYLINIIRQKIITNKLNKQLK